jgi:predicted nucleic acid-binding protein
METTGLGSHKPAKFQVLVDSDAFIGRAYPDDAHHPQASDIFRSLKARGVHLVTTSFVVVETATVLSHRQGQDVARFFLDEVIAGGAFPVIFITEALYTGALNLFKKQTRKGTSVVDCANVAVVRQFAIPTIFSFDHVYPKKFGVKLAGA